MKKILCEKMANALGWKLEKTYSVPRWFLDFGDEHKYFSTLDRVGDFLIETTRERKTQQERQKPGSPGMKGSIMRTEFVETENRKKAERECPWASHIVKVDGGFKCFESRVDFETWKNQK